MSAADAVHCCLNWVAGGFFIATHWTMARWTTQYIWATEWLLAHRLMRTDQQQLLAMRTPEAHLALAPLLSPDLLVLASDQQPLRGAARQTSRTGAEASAATGLVDIQTFASANSDGRYYSCWTHLGYLLMTSSSFSDSNCT